MSNKDKIWKVYAHIVPKEISKYEHDKYFQLSNEQKYKILSMKRVEYQNHKSCESKMVKNLDTNIIYPSLKAAGQSYGAKDGVNISNAINRNGTAYGSRWTYV